MFVVAKHEISDAAKFWATADAMAGMPEGVKLHQVLPDGKGSTAVCLWEADSLNTVRDLVESAVGQVSRNEYFEVNPQRAMGLPR